MLTGVPSAHARQVDMAIFLLCSHSFFCPTPTLASSLMHLISNNSCAQTPAAPPSCPCVQAQALSPNLKPTPCTSRHISGATLPRLNFCIAQEELQPVIGTMLALEHRSLHQDLPMQPSPARQACTPQRSASFAAAIVREMGRLNVFSPNAHRVWNLQSPTPNLASKL